MIAIEQLTGDTVFLSWRETINNLIDNTNELNTYKAPQNHASTEITYGIGSETSYGHLKITDNISLDGNAANGIAPSIYITKQLDTKLTNLSTNVLNELSNKANAVHTHKNIVSSGNVTLVPSSLNASETTTQITLEGCSISESYNDDNGPTNFGNVLNIRGKNHVGGGQLFLDWKGVDSTTGDVYYRSHNETNSGGWGNWRKLLYADNPVIEGTLTATSTNITNLTADTANIENQINAKNLTTTGTVNLNNGFNVIGAGYVSGNMTVNGTLTANKVHNAVWNDYAEFFPRGEETEPGDIIALDTSHQDMYVKSYEDCDLVVGVHSDSYGHILGGESGMSQDDNEKSYIPVGLSGRVYVKIIGACNLGDTIVPSHISGVGKSANYVTDIKRIVGYVVEDKLGGTELRKVKVLLK